MGPAPLVALLLLLSGPVLGQEDRAVVPVPEAAPPAPDALPQVPETSDRPRDPWLSVPEPVMIEHLTISKCEEPLGPAFDEIAPVRAELSATATLYAIPCSAGASRPTYRLYVHETGEIEGVHPTFLAVYTKAYGWQGAARVRAVEWDGERGHLLAEGPLDADRRIGAGIWSWGPFGLKMERYSLIDQAGRAELIYAAPE